MPARHTAQSKTASSVSSSRKPAKGRASRRTSGIKSTVLEAVRGRGGRGFDALKYAAPAAALIASTAVAAASYAFKDQIGEVLLAAVKSATARMSGATSAASHAMEAARETTMSAAHRASDQVSVDSLLRHAGLERRSTLRAVMGPAVGVAVGLVAGSVLTHLFGDTILEQFKSLTSAEPVQKIDQGETDHASTPATTSEEARPNGLQRGLS
jgi:hypothetical protein